MSPALIPTQKSPCEPSSSAQDGTMLSSSISSVTCDSPGPRGGAAANDLVGKSDVEVREAIGDKFAEAHLSLDHLHRSPRCAPGAWIIGRWMPSAHFT